MRAQPDLFQPKAQHTRLEVPELRPADARFDGADYRPERDNVRLTGQIKRVYGVMESGRWLTLNQIQKAIRGKYGREDPVASISAQLRHLRKPRFGSHTVRRRHIEGGLYEYRLEGDGR